jgi:hypothetical protein
VGRDRAPWPTSDYYISDMLDGMKRDGSLQRIIHETELRGIEVVAPQ